MAKLTKERLIGLTYGYLTITDYIGREGANYKVLAKCRCGNIKDYYLGNLRKRHTWSCGCYKMQRISEANTTHGISIKHPLYKVWGAMKERCEKPKHKSYQNYGGKGVRVCELWRKDFKSFYSWCVENGWHKGMHVDKDIIPKRLNVPAIQYSPEMCSIVTLKENQNNRSDNIIVDYKGESLTLSQLADKYNIKYRLLWERHIKRKWDLERAITTPIKK